MEREHVNHKFRTSLTGDFFDRSDGSLIYPDFDLAPLESHSGIEWAAFKEHQAEIHPDQLDGIHAVIVLSPSVSAKSLTKSDDLLVLSRFGVGYDAVDIEACTAANVAVCITAGAVDRPVAEATVGWMIALSHRVRIKDTLVREGNWDIRSRYMGSELRDRTLGIIGLGGIGRALVSLLQGFGMQPPLVYDPHLTPEQASDLGARLVPLDELLSEADFVSLHCPLTETTRGLISTKELALMKPDAFLINTARGGIVDEEALFQALENQTIAGAALDCFADEPITKPHRFGKLENVLLAPHCIAWTHEMFRDIGRTACENVIEFAEGRRPAPVVNPEVFERQAFHEKWKRLGLRPPS